MQSLISLTIAGAAMIGNPALATGDAPNQAIVIDGEDVAMPAINPCTDELVIVSFTDIRAVVRSAIDGAGNDHELAAISGSWTADDYSGRFRQLFRVNDFNLGAFDNFTFGEVVMSVGNGPEGQVLSHLHIQFRVIDGQATVELEQLDAKCVGHA